MSSTKRPVIIVHGGAWDIPDTQLEQNILGVRKAVHQGWNILSDNGSSLDAVESSVNHMEDNPIFNAGTGSVLTEDRTIEMDALIMSGRDLKAGAVAGLRDVRNPVSLARKVMEETRHVFMIGEGASRLADRFKLKRITQNNLVTNEAILEWETYKDNRKKYGDSISHETIGAVAIDIQGNIACATSTGGITFKQVGRVGDVPIVGSGGYADNFVGGVSSTGDGESITRVTLARLILFYMEKSTSVQNSVENALDYMQNRTGSQGGAIALDKDGNIGHFHTTKRMGWAYIKEGKEFFGIN
jgi:beta-aspartyl-peptidase (threonine type)